MKGQTPGRGVVVCWRPRWDLAVEEATRRQQVCREKFGPARHGWVLTVRRWDSPLAPRHARLRSSSGWVLIFDGTQVRD